MVGGERSNVLLPCSEDQVNTLKSRGTEPVCYQNGNAASRSSSHKFREPPIPSVLPKPPSHWVSHPVAIGDHHETIACQLKSLLKVQS
uniref:Uncharacterized protein n=1 Tax=Oncorhynchus kisutch TaxID=8019 RepID=A0A8C7H3K5_ONCKI